MVAVTGPGITLQFKEEISQLEGMGFSNRAMNLMALRSVGGSVQVMDTALAGYLYV